MTAVSRERPATRTTYTVERLHDPATVRAILANDRAYGAYALAQLDPRLFEHNEWLISRGPAGRMALLVHSRSGLGTALFATGDHEALDAALSLHPGPRFAFGSLRPEHRATVEKYFALTRPQMMVRMSVTPATFEPVNGHAFRLSAADVSRVNRLYSIEGGVTAYREKHLEDGVYYGVMLGGQLVSIAGTHVVSRAERIAVVGNVFTHPRHRGHGLATFTTSAATQELLAYCDLVALTVEAANDPAIRIYTKLGYRGVCSLHETPLIRREPLGALSLVRRAVAGWRGRKEGKEVVIR
jgi:GNAT superfamily N-acetyltransferase